MYLIFVHFYSIFLIYILYFHVSIILYTDEICKRNSDNLKFWIKDQI